MDIRDNESLPHDKRKIYKLIPLEDTSKYLSAAYICVKDFFKILRGSHELIYRILTKAEQKDLYNSSFIYFITNNFFNNILSSRTYSDELLLLISHLLYDQIYSLHKISDFSKLFDNSNVFILLKGIIYKKDAQTFFGLVFKDIIEDYENSEYNSRDLIFKIDDLYEYMKNEEDSRINELNNSVNENEKRKEIEKKQNNEKKEINDMFKMKFSTNNEDSKTLTNSLFFMSDMENEEQMNNDSFDGKKFLEKYLIGLNKQDLINILEKENNDIMKNYIREQLECMKNDEKLYGNSKILENFQKFKDIETVLYNYQKNFYIVTNILKKIVKKLNECFELIPYSLKYICKIISISLKKKFKEITNFEIYKCVSEFVFSFVLKQFFLNPDYGSLITSIIISEEVKKNLIVIFEIWKRLISFKLYTDEKEYGNYIPFNWIFLDVVSDIFNLCEKILDFNIPDSLIDYENNDIDDNNENNINNIIKKNTFYKNSSFFSYSICYNIHNLTTLLNIIKNNKNYIFENKNLKKEISEFEIVYNNIKDKKNVFKNLKSREGKVVNFYIYYQAFYSKKFQDILFKTIKQDDIFSIKEIKNPENETQIYLNKIIRIKNLLCDLLFKSENISKNIINENVDYNNLKEIISSLSEYYKNKSILSKCFSQTANKDIDIDYNDINLDNSYYTNINPELDGMPLEWYSNTLLNCLEEIDNNKDYEKINYYELFLSLKNEINKSINKNNFEELAQALESLKNTRQHINNYIENQEKYKNLNINTDIKKFIENEIIEVEIKFRYNNNHKLINIIKKEESINYKFKKLDEFLEETKKDNVLECSNIPEFIKKFPPLTFIARKFKVDVFLIEKEINVKKGLLKYLKIVKEHIGKQFKEEEKDEVYAKVKGTIMIRLYDKLFPKKSDLEDDYFYSQCISLSWIEPKHLKQANIFFDNFLPITSSYFDQINNAKSASAKLEIICKIFEAINNVIIFNKGGGNYSTDDIAPICEYALIKAHPTRLSSNLKFLQIFMKKEDGQEKMYFDYLKAYMNIINNASYLDFYDVTEEEFNRKCREVKDLYLEEEYEM